MAEQQDWFFGMGLVYQLWQGVLVEGPSCAGAQLTQSSRTGAVRGLGGGNGHRAPSQCYEGQAWLWAALVPPALGISSPCQELVQRLGHVVSSACCSVLVWSAAW